MNVEIGAEAALFPEKDCINWIFVAAQSNSSNWRDLRNFLNTWKRFRDHNSASGSTNSALWWAKLCHHPVLCIALVLLLLKHSSSVEEVRHLWKSAEKGRYFYCKIIDRDIGNSVRHPDGVVLLHPFRMYVELFRQLFLQCIGMGYIYLREKKRRLPPLRVHLHLYNVYD